MAETGIRKLFIANRGEIAVRIIRAAQALNIKTVQAVSKADKDMLAARLADEVAEIGPAQASKSYLNAEAVIAAALASGADAVHPGYGFLSENAYFAARVEEAGLIFVGPDARTIRDMGDKVAARIAAQKAGVRTVPGSSGRIDPAQADALAAELGLPLMVKAAAGGGGRGIRVAHTIEELRSHLPQASSEALAAFGDGALYLERFIQRARHVEVQILGDGKDAIHLYERECSVQRRRQKVWEEAPAACLNDETREALCASAVALAKMVGYRGAGTLEYLYDETTGEFFFIEMNTRIQVEHPVTEMITGIDLVQEMLRIAGGQPLSITQDQVAIRGHAIECRINAEDPAANFQPCPGTLNRLDVPEGEGIRFDTGVYQGYTVPPFYDSMIGKLIVHGDTRAEALARMEATLGDLRIEGIKTTIPLHQALAASADIAALKTDTRWLEGWLEGNPLAAGQAA